MTHRSTHVLVFAFCVVTASTWLGAQVASSAYEATAVDVKGARHTASQYRDHRPPWAFADRIKWVGPQYPYGDRQSHHQGTGLFRITIDPKTGAAARVTVLRSTGYVGLDYAAFTALSGWRWKPGTWKQVDMPITFQMSSGPPTRLPPGATRLPPR